MMNGYIFTIILLLLAINIGSGYFLGRYGLGFPSGDTDALAQVIFFLAILCSLICFGILLFESILLLFTREKRKSLKQIVLCLVILMISSSGFFTFYETDLFLMKKNELIAHQITTALEKAREGNHQFPASLDALVPQYIQQIPKTAWKGDFFYGSNGKSYELYGYTAGGWDTFNYNSEEKIWKYK